MLFYNQKTNTSIKYEMLFDLKTFPEIASEFGTWRIASAHIREDEKHLLNTCT